MRITSSEIGAGQDLALLLTVTLRGRAYRFGSDHVQVSNAEDDTIPGVLLFRAGLEPVEYEDAISIGSELTPDRSVSVSVLFGDDDGAGWRSHGRLVGISQTCIQATPIPLTSWRGMLRAMMLWACKLTPRS